MYNKNFFKEPTEKQKIGQIGEDSACKWLEKEGYRVIERNYLKKWGEIDIVATKGNKIHFIEVKSVSRNLSDVTHVTSVAEQSSLMGRQSEGDYRAEDNMHPWKLKRLGRAVQSYFLDRNVSDETDWQFDIVTVHIDMSKRLSRVFFIPDIVL
ncbi:MAG: putative endonuclease [Parcubacteria bacterium C7867-006]|nr:MAG: putative endonuclease [Parcubacteria bacterium C7867-006]